MSKDPDQKSAVQLLKELTHFGLNNKQVIVCFDDADGNLIDFKMDFCMSAFREIK